jgi:hypothetical protein
MNERNFVSISELASVIHPRRSGQRFMAIIRAYFDASFTSTSGLGSGITTIGGYLGTDDEWVTVEREWLANLALWELREFHLAELLAGNTHLGREKGELCALSFARILGNSNLHNIGASVRVEDWNARLKGLSGDFPDAYHFCFRMMLGELVIHMMNEFPEDLAAVIADTDNANLFAAKYIFDKVSEFNSGYLASLTFSRRCNFRMLECADLYAGEERKAWLSSQSWVHPDINKLYSFSMTGKGRFSYWAEATQQGLDERRGRAGMSEITPLSMWTVGKTKPL